MNPKLWWYFQRFVLCFGFGACFYVFLVLILCPYLEPNSVVRFIEIPSFLVTGLVLLAEAMGIFCPLCGKKLILGAKFCHRCGNRIVFPQSLNIERKNVWQWKKKMR